jgi:hypothetical protein
MLRTIKTIADERGMGMYLSEKEAKPILPDNHPNKLVPVMIIIEKRRNSFLLMI